MEDEIHKEEINNFRNLECWKRSRRFAVELHLKLQSCRFYALKNQMLKAAISIPSNISEGSERGSTVEFIRFLKIAKASSAEVFTQILIAKDLLVFPESESDMLSDEAQQISNLIQGLIRKKRQKLLKKTAAFCGVFFALCSLLFALK